MSDESTNEEKPKRIPWNKGLKKETDARLAASIEKVSIPPTKVGGFTASTNMAFTEG